MLRVPSLGFPRVTVAKVHQEYVISGQTSVASKNYEIHI